MAPIKPKYTRLSDVESQSDKLVKRAAHRKRHDDDHDGRRKRLTVAQRCFVAFAMVSFITLSVYHAPIITRPEGWMRDAQSVAAEDSLGKVARRVLAQTPLIDGHVDFPIAIRAYYGNHINNQTFRDDFENGKLKGHVDLARLHQGQSGGAFWSVFAPCPENVTDFSDENYASSIQFTLDQIDLMDRFQEIYPSKFSGHVNSSNALKAWESKQLISPLGVEGLHQIGNKVANLRRFHELGVRYATLTHNCHNKFADAALVGQHAKIAKPMWDGVSPLGQRLVHEMNRIGMMVDLAHVSEKTMIDVLDGKGEWAGSLAPPIFSHSSVYSICPHPRNVKDPVLQLVKKRNSIVMVNIAPDFISCRATSEGSMPEPVPEEATLDQVVKHIVHIGELIGYEHVGIGSDFDGIESVPTGLEDVSKYPDIVVALLKKGVSEEDVGKVVGGNILRVWKEVDRVAEHLQSTGAKPMEDDVPSLFG